jgi:Ca2+-binding RTX toxin-like protein
MSNVIYSRLIYKTSSTKYLFLVQGKRITAVNSSNTAIFGVMKTTKRTGHSMKNEILSVKVIGPTFLLIGVLALTPLTIWAESDDNSHQFGELSEGTSPVQEENVQGRTVIGSAETQIAATIVGTDEADTILGTQTDDIIRAEGGDDLVMANEGNDRVFGSSGDDLLQGNLGDDKLDGEGRNDVLIGGDFDDILSGGDGDDALFGGPGNDVLKGGEGKNRFVCADGVDTVLDYNPSKGDTITGDCETVHRL